jgi:chaperone BCS1
VDFKHASKWQAEGIFRNFYPTKSKHSEHSDSSSEASTSGVATPAITTIAEKKLPPKLTLPSVIVPVLEEEEVAELAKQFAAAIPEDEMSVRK